MVLRSPGLVMFIATVNALGHSRSLVLSESDRESTSDFKFCENHTISSACMASDIWRTAVICLSVKA